MAVTVRVDHRMSYHYDRAVSLGPQTIRLRPAPHTRTPIESYALTVSPGGHFLNWQQDPFGNFAARAVFPEPTDHFAVEVSLTARLVAINPFDFFLEETAEQFPFAYDDLTRDELAPYLQPRDPGGPRLDAFMADLGECSGATVPMICALADRLQRELAYEVRLEAGVQTCEQTLTRAAASCRDSAWLLVEVARRLGLAARFVSGYLVQLVADQAPLQGPSGPTEDFTDLHAWTEVYLPGAGWFGVDPTSGLATSEGHIPLACTPTPPSAAPVTGTLEPCETVFDFANVVTRVAEPARVTFPYSDTQWRAIDELGLAVDAVLDENDVRLTMGGEPTFVATDDTDAPEWNTDADGPTKRIVAFELTRRLWDRFAPGAVLHCGQGKWYPGEALPRWQFALVWEPDSAPMWPDRALLADPTSDLGHDHRRAGRFAHALAASLGFAAEVAMPAYEDPVYNLWREATLPIDVDPADADLLSADGRRDLVDALDRGLAHPVGWVLPLDVDPVATTWRSSPWPLRRGHLFALPGASPLGYRLPLDTLPAADADAETRPAPDPLDPDAHVDPAEGFGATVVTDTIVRTALTVEARGGLTRVFLPPLPDLPATRDLLAAIARAATATDTPIVIEGYPIAHADRLRRLSVTPDPGVVEVNVHPSSSWPQLRATTIDLYDEARHVGLAAEKFDLDGRHSGTGGGNHLTLGAATPADSPFLRRPGLLTSLLTYWQHHPALSYLFSGLFIGPTSQAPRVDEARHENLDELEVAFAEIARVDDPAPWLTDRALRHLLTDLTGNTHRTEICIDKLYSPDSATGRLGLVELRAFEMPPHPRMALVQALLVRALVARFWTHPYAGDLIRWSTDLHDRWMLPHHVDLDARGVADDLQRWGFAFDPAWLEPFVEFRFPHIGEVDIGEVHLELRTAIEPWPVLGEETTRAGTARYVDSSMERIQVTLRAPVADRYLVVCNDRTVPMQATGRSGVAIGGVRYRAWHPPSALHPTIGVDTPLVFHVYDRWRDAAIGGCTYHVSHPGGRAYEVFPVNALEAEARRSGRFEPHRHIEQVQVPVAGTADGDDPVAEGPQRWLVAEPETPFGSASLPVPAGSAHTLDLRSRR